MAAKQPQGGNGAAKLKPVFIKPDAAPVVKAFQPGGHEVNGHNVVFDWRDPDVLSIEIDTSADGGMANVLVTDKKEGGGKNYTLAKTKGTMYGAAVIQTPDGAQWYLTVKAEKVQAKAAKAK